MEKVNLAREAARLRRDELQRFSGNAGRAHVRRVRYLVQGLLVIDHTGWDRARGLDTGR